MGIDVLEMRGISRIKTILVIEFDIKFWFKMRLIRVINFPLTKIVSAGE